MYGLTELDRARQLLRLRRGRGRGASILEPAIGSGGRPRPGQAAASLISMSSLPTREERAKAGVEARARLPAAAHADWTPAPDRPDPIALLEGQATTRIADLVPVRYGRMALSPFTFYRGAALPMAADLSTTPSSGFTVQLAGDAHLSNFGLFASPERNLLFDMNDFDETHPGPWEWDVKRLAASLVVAATGARLRRPPGRPRGPRHRPLVSRSGWPSTRRCARSTSTTPGSTRRTIAAYVDKRARAVSRPRRSSRPPITTRSTSCRS